MKNKIILNILIIIFEFIGLFLSIKSLGLNSFIYYTQLSNIFLLISCILYLFKKHFNKKIVSLFKFGSTLSVTITFLVVLFILGPSFNFRYDWLFFSGANFYYHLLCPILGFITFIFFDDIDIKGFKDVLFAFGFTLIYSIVFILLNIFRIIVGPYPFLHVYENPIYMSVFWILLIDGGTILLGHLLELFKNKI